MSSINTLLLRVKSVTWEARDILSFDLRPMAAGVLPVFTAGAHVDLHLPDGLVRSYSLTNPQGERHRYCVTINRDPASRGGSAWLCDALRPGMTIAVGQPRNNFALAEQAPLSVLFAGGIGVTPLWAMAQRLAELGRPWQMFYSARTRENAALLPEIQALAARSGGQLVLNFDQEPGGRMLDLAGLVAAQPSDAHLYCCGPLPMLAAFEAACRQRPPDHVHVEYFAASEPRADRGGFTVVLARSGRQFDIAAGKTILDVLLDAGVDVPYSCTEGVCGACETAVIEGQPDHRDLVLSKDEQAAGRTMMICCSGSRGARLVLDL